MGTFADLLTDKTSVVSAGAVFLGPMGGVDHNKFYVLAGISGDRILVCSVLINSAVNPYISRRPHLLRLQILIQSDSYAFLEHDSYINCANPIIGRLSHFNDYEFKYIDTLLPEHLAKVQNFIKESGILTQEEINMFFN